MTRIRLTPVQLSLAGFIAILLLTWVSYQPALSGAFQLDDAQNLVGLAVVEDSASFADFVLSGTAGPGGRPLALLSFAMQADEWQNGAPPLAALAQRWGWPSIPAVLAKRKRRLGA